MDIASLLHFYIQVTENHFIVIRGLQTCIPREYPSWYQSLTFTL